MSARARPGEDDPAPELAELGRAARHDLSELLGTSALHAELLARLSEGALDEKATKHLDALRLALRHLQTLLDGRAEYAWAAADPLQLTTVDVGALADEVAESIRPQLERRGGSLTVGALPTLQADGARVRAILSHLVRNAVAHSDREDVNIELQAARDADGWRIAVSDDGQGISLREREEVLRPFTRRGRASGNEERTAGIGLAVASAAARRHGGTLWIDDAEPGTIVWFTLPDRGAPVRL